jgi:hypothetical protein
MSTRVDTAPLIAGSTVCGDQGLGVLGSVIRATTGTGTHGPGLLYDDWDSGDDAKEFRALIVTLPANGSLFAYEDGSFTLTGAADGSYSLTYRLFVDGADLGPATATFTVGSGSTFSVAPAGLPSAAVVGTPTFNFSFGSAFSVAPAGIPSAAVVGTPIFSFSIGNNFSVAPDGIASTAVIGAPSFNFTIPQLFNVSPTSIASGQRVGVPLFSFVGVQLPVPPGTPIHRRHVLSAESRRAIVPQESRTALMEPKYANPGDELDYEMDWAGPAPGPWLTDGEQIATATVTPPPQITLLGHEVSGSVVRMFLRLAADATVKAPLEVLVGVVTTSTPPRRATRRLLIEVSRR